MKLKLRKSKYILLCLLLSNLPTATALADTNTVSGAISNSIPALGPAGLIAGADISVWQHQNGAAIDFQKMAQAGVRFVFIKGSDSIPKYDSQAKKYLLSDRKQAQAAGLYTGIYHYATLPDVSSNVAIILDALKQSRIVYYRLQYLGGLNSMDLPPVLDLESNCTAVNAAGNCIRSFNQQQVTLWSLTFLKNLSRLTNRKAILTTYPTFIQNYMYRDPQLAQFPLWIAQYGNSPAVSTAQPGLQQSGCLVTAWTGTDCTNHWSIWQYTSCGIGSKYGLPNGRIDLNVFNGSAAQFNSLIYGTWQPDIFSPLPFGENTTGNIETVTASDTNHAVIINADFKRPNGTEVLTGKLTFTNGSTTQSSGSSTFYRLSNGTWQLIIKGLKAGIYIGTVDYTDPSGLANSLSLPVTFQVNFAAPPKPSKNGNSPTKPYDYCANQFIN